MSLVNAPSREEVMGWNSQTLADYMRRLNLSSCDSVVLQSRITGAHFMRMTQSQLQVFPSLYLPILTNIQREINTGEQKKTFGPKSNTQKTPTKVFKQEEEDWKSDEFSNESEYHEDKTEEDNYICHVFEQQTAEEQRSKEEEDEEKNYSLPTREVPVKTPRALRAQDHHRGSKTPHPHSTRMKPSTQRTSPTEIHYSDLKMERSKKPGHTCPSQRTFSQTKGSSVKASCSSVSHFPQPRALLPTDVSKRTSKFPPVPPVPTQPSKLNKATPEPRECLDPSWYRGNVTRREAEAALRGVNKDGAFIVRDSSQSSAEHPHTLMLLNQGKVYNIRIRRQGNSYRLGNGLNSTKSFPRLTEVIIHHMNTPLLLIDATNQSSAERPQCCLLYPAGL